MGNLLNFTGIRLFLACAMLMVCGLTECFAGFKILRGVLIGLGVCIGALAGRNLGGIIVEQLGIADSYTTLICAACAVILALTLSMLAFRFYLAGTFILNGFFTFIIVYSLCGVYALPNIAAAAAGIIAGMTAGFASVKLFRPFTIISTSVIGGTLVGLGVYAFLKNRYGFYANAIPALVCTLSGITVQFKTTKKHISKP